MVIHRSYHHHNLIGVIISLLLIRSSLAGKQYLVGDTIWTIPSPPSLYTNWSSSTILFPGDSLVFDFESEFNNVMQVTRLDYDACTTQTPIKTMLFGPAIVPLIQPGVFYFICNVSNHCDLGQKVSITVHKQRTNLPSPAPSQVPLHDPLTPSSPPSSPQFRPLEPPWPSPPIASPTPMPSSDHGNPSSRNRARVDKGNSIAILFLILVMSMAIL